MKKYIKPALEMHKLDLPLICLNEEDEVKVSNTENSGLEGGDLDLTL